MSLLSPSNGAAQATVVEARTKRSPMEEERMSRYPSRASRRALHDGVFFNGRAFEHAPNPRLDDRPRRFRAFDRMTSRASLRFRSAPRLARGAPCASDGEDRASSTKCLPCATARAALTACDRSVTLVRVTRRRIATQRRRTGDVARQSGSRRRKTFEPPATKIWPSSVAQPAVSVTLSGGSIIASSFVPATTTIAPFAPMAMTLVWYVKR